MKNIIFLRHAETVGNLGTNDDAAKLEIPNHRFHLTERGRQQVRFAREFLQTSYPQGIDVGFVSTFRRTEETYNELNKEGFLPEPIRDARLDEKYDGIFHGLTSEKIGQNFPIFNELRDKEGWYHFRAPGGRNGPDVELSIHSFLDMLEVKYPDKNILAVCHGTWLVLLFRILLNLTAEEIEKRKKELTLPNCSLVTLDRTKKLSFFTFAPYVPWRGRMEEPENTHLA